MERIKRMKISMSGCAPASGGRATRQKETDCSCPIYWAPYKLDKSSNYSWVIFPET